MKKNLFKVGLLFLGALVLTGCTKSFSTIQDKANMMIVYENTKVDDKTTMETIISSVKDKGYYVPSENYFNYVEEKIVENVQKNYGSATLDGMPYSDISKESLLNEGETRTNFVQSNEYALIKYAKEKTNSLDDLWYNYDLWRSEALKDGLTLEDVGSNYFFNEMKTSFNNYANTITATITPVDGVFDGLKLQGKGWGYTFTNVGLIEGLLVWPIAALLYYFAMAFSSLGVGGIVLSILLVTIIVRGLLLLLTFKQTASQQKLTALQPQIAKLQEKYPHADTNQYEKQAMAQEQMELYKKNHVNPFSMFIVLLVQFPVFIAVWGAMSGSAVLREGELWGLRLSANTGSSIIHWTGTPSVVALVIFIIMAITQAVSMLLPQFLQKKRTEKVAKLNKNPTAAKTNNQMMIMNIVMLVMIIFTGTQLPVAMSIYWIITALISLVQSLVMSHITNRKGKNYK